MMGSEKEEVKGSNGLVHVYFLQRFVKFELACAFSEILGFLCTFIKISNSQNEYKQNFLINGPYSDQKILF